VWNASVAIFTRISAMRISRSMSKIGGVVSYHWRFNASAFGAAVSP